MIDKMDHFPKVWGENENDLKPQPRKHLQNSVPINLLDWLSSFSQHLASKLSYVLVIGFS